LQKNHKTILKISRAFIGFFFLTIFYVGALLWTDSKKEVFSQIPLLVNAIPALIGISFFSYLVRYSRWQWLLRRAGYKVALGYGFLSYLAGFAFTATPGKVGELIRIRYFNRANVPASTSFGAFVFERAFDLIVVLLLASLVISQQKYFIIALSFVLIFLVFLILLAMNATLVNWIMGLFDSLGWRPLAKLTLIVQEGLSACRFWFNPLDLFFCFVYGIIAWSATAAGFLLLTQDLGISIESITVFAMYPLAMLVGAASMLPGGVGTTELTIVLLLGSYGVSTSLATLAAVGIRLATIWFAMLVGFMSVAILEWQFVKEKD
jgi:uncharacterized protein (TIRG00374 family)